MLDYVALGLLVFVVLTVFYGVIAIHDIPYEISKHRNHPHQDAIHIAGWVSLLTLHVLWPFLWIWASLYRPERGWGFNSDAGANANVSNDNTNNNETKPDTELEAQIQALRQRIELLEQNRQVTAPQEGNQ